MNNFLKYSLIVFLTSISSFNQKQTILAQQHTPLSDTSSIEYLFYNARQHAYNKEREEARRICRQILSIDSTYWDATVLIGRTYSWDAKYDSARVVLSTVLKSKAGYYDAMDALIDNEYYCGDYIRSINYSDKGLSFHPNDETFLYKKARAMDATGDYQSAVKILNTLIERNPQNKEASDKLLTIKRESRVNKIGITYGVYAFDNDTPWIFSSTSLGRKTSGLGTVTIRYNYARRFNQDGHQFEIDAYPSIAKGIYLYLNTGFSNKTNFPFSRFTFEPYFKLPAGFELSVGIRYMNFDQKRLFAFDSSMVMIYTGTIGKYAGNYWFSLRPYLTPGDKNLSGSVNLTIRRYFKDAENYLSLTLGTGMSPEEQQYAYNPNTNYLKSKKISLDYQQKIAHRFIFNCGTGYAREEIKAGKRINRYSIDAGFGFMF